MLQLLLPCWFVLSSLEKTDEFTRTREDRESLTPHSPLRKTSGFDRKPNKVAFA